MYNILRYCKHLPVVFENVPAAQAAQVLAPSSGDAEPGIQDVQFACPFLSCEDPAAQEVHVADPE